MDDLTAFLAARLDEDEAAAKAALEQSAEEGTQWWFDDAAPETPREFHVARHDPARVLREVEAGRTILAEHVPYDCTEPKGQRCFRCASDRAYRSGAAIHEAWPCLTLRILAAVYSDHPDYRPEWKP
jgi:hypothetical protein